METLLSHTTLLLPRRELSGTPSAIQQKLCHLDKLFFLHHFEVILAVFLDVAGMCCVILPHRGDQV
jgi:hypothetical protein